MTLDIASNNGVTVLTLDRPEAANAINPAMSQAFCAALRTASGAVVLTGRGARVFCGGPETIIFPAAHRLESMSLPPFAAVA